MVMVSANTPVQFAALVTVSVTMYVPPTVQVWEVFWMAEVLASPKSHDQPVMPAPMPLSGMLEPAHAVGGIVKVPEGGGFVVTVLVIETVHDPSETVSVTR